MISEAFIDFFAAFTRFAIGLLPDSGPPGWFSDGTGYLSEVWSYASGLGAWIPFAHAGMVVTSILACVAIGLTIKLVRIVASFFTVGGGSAG